MPRQLALLLTTLSLAFAGCATPAPTTQPPAVAPPEDQMNPFCIVLAGENVTDQTVIYQGKRYHVCCTDCAAAFNKNPEKYVQAFNANPAAYGIN